MNFSDNFFKRVEKKTNVDKNTILDLADKLQKSNMKDEKVKKSKSKNNSPCAANDFRHANDCRRKRSDRPLRFCEPPLAFCEPLLASCEPSLES